MAKLVLPLLAAALPVMSGCASVPGPTPEQTAAMVAMDRDGVITLTPLGLSPVVIRRPTDPDYKTARVFYGHVLGGLRRGQSKPLGCTNGSLLRNPDGSIQQIKLIGSEFRILHTSRPGDPDYRVWASQVKRNGDSPVYVTCPAASAPAG